MPFLSLAYSLRSCMNVITLQRWSPLIFTAFLLIAWMWVNTPSKYLGVKSRYGLNRRDTHLLNVAGATWVVHYWVLTAIPTTFKLHRWMWFTAVYKMCGSSVMVWSKSSIPSMYERLILSDIPSMITTFYVSAVLLEFSTHWKRLLSAPRLLRLTHRRSKSCEENLVSSYGPQQSHRQNVLVHIFDLFPRQWPLFHDTTFCAWS